MHIDKLYNMVYNDVGDNNVNNIQKAIKNDGRKRDKKIPSKAAGHLCRSVRQAD